MANFEDCEKKKKKRQIFNSVIYNPFSWGFNTNVEMWLLPKCADFERVIFTCNWGSFHLV